MITQKTGRIDIDWLKRLRQRSKISFSKDRYDDKLKELESRIESLHKLRKHIEHFEDTREAPASSSSERVDHFRVVQSASAKLHDALETHWNCESSEVHSANICLESPKGSSQDIYFDLAWSCPGPSGSRNEAATSIRLTIEAFLDSQKIPSVTSQQLNQQQILKSVLGETVGSAKCIVHSKAVAGSSRASDGAFGALAGSVPDLYAVPDLCRHLIRQPATPAPSHCIGFLQKTKTFKHIIYAPASNSPTVTAAKTLSDALQAAKHSSEGIPLPEKLCLAKLLALAVLRFHSTPWLNPQWQSQDVVFLDVRDFALDPLQMPFLRSSVRIQGSSRMQVSEQDANALDRRAIVQGNRPMRSHIRNQTLYNLGVMLIELAYDSPFEDLQVPEDDQGDLFTSYWAAERLGESVRRVLGQRYAEAVKICLHCGFGPLR